MIKKAKVLSVSKRNSNGIVPEIVVQTFIFGIIPSIKYNVYDNTEFNVKVGQWIYIYTYMRKVVGIV